MTALTQWWCGPLDAAWPSHPGHINECVETSFFVATVWKLAILTWSAIVGWTTSHPPGRRDILYKITAALSLVSAVCGSVYIASLHPLYPCQVYAGTVWIVEGAHAAVVAVFAPQALRSCRYLLLLDVATRCVVFKNMAHHDKLSILDAALIADTSLGLLRTVCAFSAHWRHARSDLPSRRSVYSHPLEENAAYVSQLLFLWIWPLLRQGYAQQSLRMKDLPPVHSADATATLLPAFRARWVEFPSHSLLRHLHAVCWHSFYHAAALMMVATAAGVANPLLLHALLQALTASSAIATTQAAGLAALWCGALVVNCVFVHRFWAVAVRCGMHTRSILQQFAFEKALRLSASARQSAYSAGRIHSLIAMDAARLCDNYVVCSIHWDTWSAMVTLAVCGYFLFDLLSYAALVWLGTIGLYAPFALYFGNRIQRHSAVHQQCRDDRTTIFTQMLRGVLTVKANAYESWCEARLGHARRLELTALKWKAMHITCNKSLVLVADIFAPMLTFLVFVHVQHGHLDATTAFSALAWFNTAASPLLRLPYVLVTLVDAMVSLRRLEAFFRADERPRSALLPPPGALSSATNAHLYHAIEIKDVTCRWTEVPLATDGDDSKGRPDLFAGLTMVVPKGQFVVCCGPVGCGKSSFLELCIHMLAVSSGSVAVHGTVAYCAQTPWIQNTTVRDNILFGQPMDRMWYKMTLYMCALDEDLARWPSGDATIAGDQGCALSGGQKHRIALARAIYARRDILLLDDVLASLDTHVGHHIFTRCLCSPALAYMTKILVTNQPAFVSHAAVDRVLYFDRAEATNPGEFSIQPPPPSVFKAQGIVATTSADATPAGPSAVKGPRGRTTLPSLDVQEASPPERPDENSKTPVPPSTEPADQLLRQGALDRRVIALYLKALGSKCAVAAYAVLLVVEHSLVLGGAYCLSQWCSHDSSRASSFAQLLFISLGIAQACTSVVRKILFVVLSLASSASLHHTLVHALVHASMRFFDTTSLGVILNRCVKDIAALDEDIPYAVTKFLSNTVEIVLSLVPVTLTTPAVLLFVLVLVYPCMYMNHMYRWPARDLKRLQSMTRSPILSHFNEISQGTSTISAFDAAATVSATSMHYIDESVRSYWPSLVASQWVTVWLELLGIMIVAAAAASCVWLRSTGRLDASLVGLVFTYASQVPSRMGWMVKMVAAMEVDFVALERIDQLTTIASFHKDHRSLLSTDQQVVPERWDQPDGALHFRHVSMAYGTSAVLRDIHVDIPRHAKVAVVGRTGAGKSSLVRALLGLYPIQGTIALGSVDLATVSTTTLRQQILGFIPQDAVLVGSTVREGLVGNVSTATVRWTSPSVGWS
ncbi:hypothetical protein, variant [Aphanomyces invadans]|uniref:ABC transmembrane type-1 domain-containing protein n=1 Tax=Aphanomyces invadans TaxID=157072 RepID=A0A024UHP8_9STRA|nr:hypothetical protein, variant [Aphanomyces invadans]ETW05148.1 hypothetical protein, variant [Aphanomyces invadans]|eukprot:XP_008866585.1 hypothetical protein, variant [Aphanomyces invadans]